MACLGVENAEADGMNTAISPTLCTCSELECGHARNRARVGLHVTCHR